MAMRHGPSKLKPGVDGHRAILKLRKKWASHGKSMIFRQKTHFSLGSKGIKMNGGSPEINARNPHSAAAVLPQSAATKD